MERLRYMFDQNGRVVERDTSEFRALLCVHWLSLKGKAWLVSIDGESDHGVWIPKGCIDIGEAVGGFQRMRYGRAIVVPICECSMPMDWAIQKGLVPREKSWAT